MTRTSGPLCRAMHEAFIHVGNPAVASINNIVEKKQRKSLGTATPAAIVLPGTQATSSCKHTASTTPASQHFALLCGGQLSWQCWLDLVAVPCTWSQHHTSPPKKQTPADLPCSCINPAAAFTLRNQSCVSPGALKIVQQLSTHNPQTSAHSTSSVPSPAYKPL